MAIDFSSSAIILPGHSPEMRHRPHHQIPRIQAVRRFASGAEIFRDIDLWLDGGDDGIGDLVLNRKNVSEISVVAVRPDVASCRRVVELCGDAHEVAVLPHAALDDVAHAQFLGDLLQVNGPCPCI
jgi:hypothetical protein